MSIVVCALLLKILLQLLNFLKKILNMYISVIIGSTGVFILLLAFIMNLFKKLSSDSFLYSLMNFVGAILSGYASILIHYTPFIILEFFWAAVAGTGMIKALVKPEKTSLKKE